MDKTEQIKYELSRLRQEYKNNPDRRWAIELQAKCLKTALNAPAVISESLSKTPKNLLNDVKKTLL